MEEINLSEELEKYFASDGILAQNLPGYKPREGQKKLSQIVLENLETAGILLAEAGTGIGKTFAYLLPALLRGEKILVSTATKNLQEQIFKRDLPFVCDLVNKNIKTALLKGRSNYFCHHAYAQSQSKGAFEGENPSHLHEVELFPEQTLDGDVSALRIPENSPLIRKITSTADSCIGKKCDFFEDCFVQKARLKAQQADVVVVNHYLLLADLVLKDEEFAAILPTINSIIIDESHHLPHVAQNFLTIEISQVQLLRFFDDLFDALKTDAPDASDILMYKSKISSAISSANLRLRHLKEGTYDAEQLENLTQFQEEFNSAIQHMRQFRSELAQHRERSPTLQKAFTVLEEYLGQIEQFFHADSHANSNVNLHADSEKNTEDETEELQEIARKTPFARWLSIGKKHLFSLHLAPVEVGGYFAKWFAGENFSWNLLSATLTAGGDFGHFRRKIGLAEDKIKTISIASPFDYRKRSVLYHPQNLPQPSDEKYIATLMQAAIPVLEITRGRALFLFTSYKAMQEALEILASKTKYTLFCQGDDMKHRLIEKFRRSPNAVLLATQGFWEGVDIRGKDLVFVLIDRLPFSVPTDPVSKLRKKLLEEKGLQPFIVEALPQAIISLKQGAGRLIRDYEDYGVLMIADPRLSSMNYGKQFLQALPRMTKATEIDIVQRLFACYE
ncbi:MAG: ATP-dependent DNA helicase [Cardiobacteriaceae bacterium]|nr:ATP-dependent DNA helicase [Cardiobacteriaceae bacterium]